MLGKLNSRAAPDGSANIYSYGINARGRMSTVTLGGTQIAAYTYDQSEQRIIKTAANQTTHYHYDSEGRLIAETDGATGETISAECPQSLEKRLQQSADIGDDVGFYIVLNPADLQPLLKSIHRIDFLTLRVSALRYARADWDGNVAFREDKIAEMQAQLATLSGKKAEKLAEKIERWEGMITDTSAKIGDAEAELTLLDTQITDTQTALTAQQALCDGSGPVTNISGTYYLHADHLGRPQFATDSDGSVVWDMGDGVTPFGEGVNLAGAFAQKLMFPGQYADAETGAEITLSHNWHRTYDPTLGRYLQADPIGLAGGLNRFAYVGGNPMGFVDPTGLRWIYEQSTGRTYYEEEDDCECSSLPPSPNTSNFSAPIEGRNFTPENPGVNGYAGAPGYVNNPFSDSISSSGPAPRGLYTIESPRHSRQTGPYALPLSPNDQNDMFGRSAFQIHGDNASGNQSASSGCIILPLSVRQQIWTTAQQNNDFILEVRR